MPFRRLRNEKVAPKLVLVGSFGAGNVGDELILAGFLRKLGREAPRARITVLAGNPQLVRRWHGVDALPHLPSGLRSFFRKGWCRSWRSLREADAVIFPGGGLFTDSESALAVALWGGHILAARYFWKPVFLLGQSVGPLAGERARQFTRFCLRKAEWIGVRDGGSAAELRRLGIPAKKIKASNDSARWLVNRVPKTKKLKRGGRLKILISVRSFPKIGEEFWGELAQALDQISEKLPARIVFAEFGGGDAEIWRRVCKLSRHSKSWKTLALPESAEGVLKAVKQFDVVVGMRLHSLIAAQLAGVPAVGLAYSRKVGEFAKNSLAVEGFEAEKLVKLFR